LSLAIQVSEDVTRLGEVILVDVDNAQCGQLHAFQSIGDIEARRTRLQFQAAFFEAEELLQGASQLAAVGDDAWIIPFGFDAGQTGPEAGFEGADFAHEVFVLEFFGFGERLGDVLGLMARPNQTHCCGECRTTHHRSTPKGREKRKLYMRDYREENKAREQRQDQFNSRRQS
jgi:hypothetical protein